MPVIYNQPLNTLPVVTNTRINHNTIPIKFDYHMNPLKEDKSRYLLTSCVTLKLKNVNSLGVGYDGKPVDQLITGNNVYLFKYVHEEDSTISIFSASAAHIPEKYISYNPIDAQIIGDKKVFNEVTGET